MRPAGDEIDSSTLDRLLDEILTDTNGDDEQLWAFRQAFEDWILARYVPGEFPTGKDLTSFPFRAHRDRDLEQRIPTDFDNAINDGEKGMSLSSSHGL